MIAVVLFLVILGLGFIKASQDLVNFDRVEHDNFFIAVHNPVVLFKFFLWLLTMVVLLSILIFLLRVSRRKPVSICRETVLLLVYSSVFCRHLSQAKQNTIL